jgi:hypothetical protein
MPNRESKTFWKDIGDLRLPNSNWRLGRAARWWAETLDLPVEAIRFVLPGGRLARSDKKLASLRASE